MLLYEVEMCAMRLIFRSNAVQYGINGSINVLCECVNIVHCSILFIYIKHAIKAFTFTFNII